MVIITHKPEEQSYNMTDNQCTIERLMQVEGDSFMDIVNSDKIPQHGSRHPASSLFSVSGVSIEPVGNVGRRVQAAVRVTYTNNSATNYGSAGNRNDGGKDPWKLGATDVSEDYTTERVPLRYGYDNNGNYFQLRNSAGSRLEIETDRIIRQVSFSFAVKASQSGEPPLNNKAIINSGAEKVAGYTFTPYSAMLMPMKAAYVVDVDDDGDVYRRYWNITAVILEHPVSWVRKALDVGRMAKFKQNGFLQPIYQYSPWTSKKDEDNLKVQPKFGSIDDVVAAKIKYADLWAGSERASRFDSLPYNEVTEPLPLSGGQVYEDALRDPAKKPIREIEYYEYKPGAWSRWNLPKTRV